MRAVVFTNKATTIIMHGDRGENLCTYKKYCRKVVFFHAGLLNTYTFNQYPIPGPMWIYAGQAGSGLSFVRSCFKGDYKIVQPTFRQKV